MRKSPHFQGIATRIYHVRHAQSRFTPIGGTACGQLQCIVALLVTCDLVDLRPFGKRL